MAKERPRIDTRGPTPRVYTPSATRKGERLAKQALQAELGEAAPSVELIAMELLFCVTVPVGRKVSDLDNLAKLVLDAGNRVLYADDKQIVDLLVRRRVVAEGSRHVGTLVVVGSVPR